MMKLKLISKILCIAFSALTIVVYGKIEPLSVQGQGTASSRTGLFHIISGIFKNDYHESTIGMEESKTPKQRITGFISYILSDSGKCCEPSNPPSSPTPPKLPDHENCSENEKCESNRCEKTPTCNFIACCIPETGLNNGSRCNSKDQCMSDYCNESNVCSEKRPINSGCQADEDCVSGLVCSQGLCKIGVGETCENHNECETGRCSKENKCKVKEIVGANCEQNVDCEIGICSDNICGFGIGDACENKNECGSNICSDSKCKIGLSGSCQSSSECETGRCSKEKKCKMIVGANCEQNVDCDSGICSDNICKLGVGEACENKNECETNICSDNKCKRTIPDKELVNPDPDIHLGESCDMSERVAVLVGDNHNNDNHLKAVMYVDGELKKEITPVPSNSPEFSHSYELARIDKYIVFNSDFGLQIFDRSGQFKKTILNRANSDNYDSIKYIATAGDLVAAQRYWKPYKLMIYFIETGEKKHEMDCFYHSSPEMTTKHLVVRGADNKINIYSIENNFQLIGTISREGLSQFYSIFGEKIVVVGNHDGVGYGKIYDTKGSLITSLTLPTEVDLKKHFGKGGSLHRNIVSMNDQFIVVGVPLVDGGNGAIYVFDSENGSFLQKRNSPSPMDNEGYGSCVALSGSYMVSTSKHSYSSSSPAYFQSVINNPSSKEIYTKSTAGTDEIMIADY